mmetsp:Transcript_30801/g.64647  ORF Transcript_30801/g.64647 Transcript_30801/m.64647 type:complete len:428 (+) Transcript_30801:456-1739(+)
MVFLAFAAMKGAPRPPEVDGRGKMIIEQKHVSHVRVQCGAQLLTHMDVFDIPPDSILTLSPGSILALSCALHVPPFSGRCIPLLMWHGVPLHVGQDFAERRLEDGIADGPHLEHLGRGGELWQIHVVGLVIAKLDAQRDELGVGGPHGRRLLRWSEHRAADLAERVLLLHLLDGLAVDNAAHRTDELSWLGDGELQLEAAAEDARKEQEDGRAADPRRGEALQIDLCVRGAIELVLKEDEHEAKAEDEQDGEERARHGFGERHARHGRERLHPAQEVPAVLQHADECRDECDRVEHGEGDAEGHRGDERHGDLARAHAQVEGVLEDEVLVRRHLVEGELAKYGNDREEGGEAGASALHPRVAMRHAEALEVEDGGDEELRQREEQRDGAHQELEDDETDEQAHHARARRVDVPLGAHLPVGEEEVED